MYQPCRVIYNLVKIILVASLSFAPLSARADLPCATYLKAYYAYKNLDMPEAILGFGILLNNNGHLPQNDAERLISAYLLDKKFEDAYNVALSIPQSSKSKLAFFIKLIHGVKNGHFNASLINDAANLDSLFDKISVELIKAWIFYVHGKEAQARAIVRNIENIAQQEPLLEKFMGSEQNKNLMHMLALYNLGLLSYKHDARKSEEYFSKALKAYQKSTLNIELHDRILINYIKLLQQRRKLTLAKKILKQEAEQYPDDLLISDLLTKLQQQQPIKDNFLDHKDKANFTKEAIAENLANIASILQTSGLTQSAWFYNNMAVQIAPDNTSAIWQYSKIITLYNKLKSQKFKINYDIFENIAPSSLYYFDAQIQKSVLYTQQKDYRKSIALLTSLYKNYKTLQATKKLDIISYFLVSSYVSDNQYNKAAQILEEDLTGDSDASKNWSLYYLAGAVFSHLKQIDKAIKYFEIAVKTAPLNAELLNYYGYTLLENNKDLAKALELLAHAADLSPGNGYILDSLGWAYYHNKNYATAITYLRLAAQLLPDSGEVSEHLGDAYWKNNNKIEAKYEWQYTINISKDEARRKRVKNKLKNGLDAIAAAYAYYMPW